MAPQMVQVGQADASLAKAEQTNQEINEVIVIMQNNIEKVAQRGEKLENLAIKTEELQQGL